jgi:hypothetical protein
MGKVPMLLVGDDPPLASALRSAASAHGGGKLDTGEEPMTAMEEITETDSDVVGIVGPHSLSPFQTGRASFPASGLTYSPLCPVFSPIAPALESALAVSLRTGQRRRVSWYLKAYLDRWRASQAFTCPGHCNLAFGS